MNPRLIRLWRLLTSADYRRQSREFRRTSREHRRLAELPRYQRTTTALLGKTIEIVDAPSFLGMYDEIFRQEIFRFPSRTDRPYIIDGGANIGMATIYFKRLFPQARVVAFEPDPDVFKVLEANTRVFDLSGLELVCAGLWSTTGTLPFLHEGADGGRIAHAIDDANQSIKVVRLKDYIDRQVDFLKLDIEGAEVEVLRDAHDQLRAVDHLFVEFHSFEKERQRLHEMLQILDAAGFRVHIDAWQPARQPFIARNLNMGMDMQLNISAYRGGAGFAKT